MAKINVEQSGSAQSSLIVAILMSVLFVFALIFGFVMLAAKQDLSSNMDTKVAKAVAEEAKKIEAEQQANYDEKEKSPTKTYSGPSTLGSVTFSYPKTYSAYVIEATSTNGGTPLDAFFHPNFVPKEEKSVQFALRLEVISTSYDAVVKQYDASLKSGKITSKAFRATAVPDILGVRLDGEIVTGKQGSVVVLPLRDKTLRIWTESKDFVSDFDKYVVPSLSFVP